MKTRPVAKACGHRLLPGGPEDNALWIHLAGHRREAASPPLAIFGGMVSAHASVFLKLNVQVRPTTM
jgi:hypothetical protein